eukprot:CAMPEP_0117662344 /NCGR_PEP_ID=MMETSP0804-20121206/8006_1 /TAXON_ID=1074897 /ORGANISM="Tetraselmis astigmatica, Strain CCMP880" /LENGTH=85 /DNA_ID=CAMNT_0005469243 /DNA_START=458 /DNA_END=715 /DNA_ORIENTATION=+
MGTAQGWEMPGNVGQRVRLFAFCLGDVKEHVADGAAAFIGLGRELDEGCNHCCPTDFSVLEDAVPLGGVVVALNCMLGGRVEMAL